MIGCQPGTNEKVTRLMLRKNTGSKTNEDEQSPLLCTGRGCCPMGNVQYLIRNSTIARRHSISSNIRYLLIHGATAVWRSALTIYLVLCSFFFETIVIRQLLPRENVISREEAKMIFAVHEENLGVKRRSAGMILKCIHELEQFI